MNVLKTLDSQAAGDSGEATDGLPDRRGQKQQRTLKIEDQGPAETQMPFICDENSSRFGLRNLTGNSIYGNGVPERIQPSMLVFRSFYSFQFSF